MVTVANYDDALVEEYRSGRIADSYALPAVKADEYVSLWWFDDEEKEMYEASDGFFPRCNSFEFTTLWYSIMERYIDELGLGDWRVEHGGLRWEYDDYDETVFTQYDVMNEVYAIAFETYKRVYDRLAA